MARDRHRWRPAVINTTLAHYRIIASLGKGGMGEVWRATDEKLGRDVALKVLPDEFAQDPDRMARFEREARVLASLNHPNIAHLYGLESPVPEEAEGRAGVRASGSGNAAPALRTSTLDPRTSNRNTGWGDGCHFLVMELVGAKISPKVSPAARSRWTRRSPLRCRLPKRSKRRTSRVSSTATSNRPTSSSPKTVWSKCSTSASPKRGRPSPATRRCLSPRP